MGTAIKHLVPDRVKPSLIIFDIWALGTLTLNPGVENCKRRLKPVKRSVIDVAVQSQCTLFHYASPYLWNQLPSSFRKPHSVHSSPGSPHPAHITSSQSLPLLSSPITPSTFYSRLKTHLFSQILSSVVSLIPSGLPSWNLY